MVWVMSTSEAVCPLVKITGSVNANIFLNLVKKHVVPTLRTSPKLPACFMKDNVPCHTVKRGY